MITTGALDIIPVISTLRGGIHDTQTSVLKPPKSPVPAEMDEADTQIFATSIQVAYFSNAGASAYQ